MCAERCKHGSEGGGRKSTGNGNSPAPYPTVPPTKSGVLVESFARQVAAQLSVEYLAVLEKVRVTREQKYLTNWLQKADNVKGAFVVQSPELVTGRVLLLIDDIYDSGYMIREVAQTLMQAGAKVVYPFTITRTAHSDDQ